MKKSLYILAIITLFFKVSGCGSYKPVYGTSKFNFIISEYSISGNAKLGDKIYSKLANASQSNDLDPETKNIYISGSSPFPKSSFANSTFTSLALSLKLADYLNKNV